MIRSLVSMWSILHHPFCDISIFIYPSWQSSLLQSLKTEPVNVPYMCPCRWYPRTGFTEKSCLGMSKKKELSEVPTGTSTVLCQARACSLIKPKLHNAEWMPHISLMSRSGSRVMTCWKIGHSVFSYLFLMTNVSRCSVLLVSHSGNKFLITLLSSF